MQQKFSRQVVVPQITAAFMSRISKSYVPFTCKFPMVMHFLPILHRRCRSKTNFYVFNYDKINLKFCAIFTFFIAVFMEKFTKMNYLSYVRREISVHPRCGCSRGVATFRFSASNIPNLPRGYSARLLVGNSSPGFGFCFQMDI